MTEITGGVTPLKKIIKKVQARRGGKKSIRTQSRGHIKHKGVKGGKGRAGYGKFTTFQRREDIKKASGGGGSKSSPPPSNKPIGYDKDGNVIVNNYITTPSSNATAEAFAGGTGGYWKEWTTEEPYEFSESYQGFWDKRIGDKSKWSKGMKRYIEKHGGDLEKAYAEWYKVSSDPKNVEARRRSMGTTTKHHREWVSTGGTGSYATASASSG